MEGFQIKKSGFADAIASAMIFGAMPLFTKTLFEYGLNPISSAFYRMSLSLVFIFLFSKYLLKYDMKLSINDIKSLVLASLSFILTSITLFNSYNYINSGTATSIHFMYPIIIFAVSAFILKQKPTIIEFVCIISAGIGIILTTDFSKMSNIQGVLLALISAFTYSFYSIYLEKSSLSKMKPLKLLFYVNLAGCIMTFVYSLLSDNPIKYDFSISQALTIIIYSLVLTVGATFLYQRAVFKIGAKYTSILSTLEPITSIILGFLILSENLTIYQIFASFLIIISTFILIKLRAEK